MKSEVNQPFKWISAEAITPRVVPFPSAAPCLSPKLYVIFPSFTHDPC